jgi:hypothetical protein
MALVGSGFFVLAGAIAWLIWFLIPPKEVQLELLSATNDTYLAAPYVAIPGRGLEDGTAFKLHMGAARTLDAKNPGEWNTWLDDCKSSGLQKGAEKVVLFLAAAGNVDEGGRPYFIVNHASPAERGQRLYVTDLLDQLRQLPAKTPKLVVLDPTQTMAYWPVGMLQNGFVKALRGREIQSEIDSIDHLCILCASGEGQRSWVCDEWGESVFAHYVREALKGAVRAHGLRGDITAGELAKFVHDKVRAWAIDNRASYQDPFLLGERSAQMVLLRDREYDSKEPEVAELEASERKDLANAWKDRDDLEERVPFVCAVAPHLWREYLEMLMRHERLLLTHHSRSATEELNKIKKSIEDAGNLRMQKSARLSLPGSAALVSSISAEEKKKLDDEFKRVWSGFDPNKDPNAKEVGTFYQSGKQMEHADAWQSRVLVNLLAEAISDPVNSLPNAALIARQLLPDAPARPAEMHFLILLDSHRRPNRPTSLESLALKITRMGEEAALGLDNTAPDNDALPAYSEIVLAQIKNHVEQGDAKRRLGQDLLFAAEDKYWTQAKGLLEEAEQHYRGAQAKALALRRVLYARDLAMMELPYYSQWQAALPSFGKRQDRLDLLEELWRKTHDLHDALEKEAVAPPIVEQATKVRQGLVGQTEAFESYCQKELADCQVLPDNWRVLEAALSVPFLPSDLRLKLIEKQQEISVRLLREFNQQSESAKGKGEVKDDETEQHRLAQRQGRLAIATYGQNWMDRDGAGKFKAVQTEVLTLSANQAFPLLGAPWAALRDSIRKQTEDGRAAPTLQAAENLLKKAAHEAHRLDGAAASSFGDLNPISEYRRLMLHNLLCWQADRRLGDHWFNKQEPYYREVGSQHVKDARQMLGLDDKQQAKDWRTERTTQLSKDLAAEPSGFVAVLRGVQDRTGKVTLHLAGDETLHQHYRLDAPAKITEAYPVYRVAKGRWLEKQEPQTQWTPTALMDAKHPQENVDFEETPGPNETPRPGEHDDTTHTLEGFFRGQEFELQTKIHIHRLPDLISRQQRMPPGAIRVQADRDLLRQYRVADTELVIVLDASGSMKTKKNNESDTRFDKALQALQKVLEGLPQGVNMSIWAFSHAGKEEEAERVWPGPEASNLRTWDPKEAGNRIADINRRVIPSGDTPLIRSIGKAIKDFSKKPLSKNLIVITDGGDNYASPKEIRDFLLANFGSGSIRITAIGFEVDPNSFKPEERAAYNIFKKTLNEELHGKGGKFIEAEDVESLVRELRESMLDLRYVIRPVNGVGKEAEGIVSRFNYGSESRLTALSSGLHWLQLQALGRPDANECLLRIREGDGIVVHVKSQDNRFIFERDLYSGAKDFVEGRRSKKDKDWIAAVHQKRYGSPDSPLPSIYGKSFRDQSLQLMATLEKETERTIVPHGNRETKETMDQPRPRLVHFEVSTADGKTAGPMCYSALPGYPAPAWSLDLPKWPGLGSAPVVHVWWSDKDLRFGQNTDLSYTVLLRRDVPGGFVVSDQPQPIQVKPQAAADDKIVLESIRIEELPVETTAGGAVQPSSCLVIRLSYPENKPYMVRIRTADGSTEYYAEHRWYSQAQKYTGIFPGWTEPELKNLQALELISIEAFKANAAKVHFEDLGAPDRGSRRPAPELLPGSVAR